MAVESGASHAPGITDVQGGADSLFDLLSDDDDFVIGATKSADESRGESEAKAEDEPAPAEIESDDEEDAGDDVESDDLEDSEQDEDEPDPAVIRHKLKINGEEVEATLDELKKGYSRETDYTRKTQKLADERKAFEAEAADTRVKRTAYGTRLELLEKALAQATNGEPDWEALRAEDPAIYAATHADYTRKEKQLAAVRAEQQRVQDDELADQNRQLGEVITAERQKVVEAIPEWKDEKVAKAEKARIVEYAGKLGYTPEVLAMQTDHRIVLLLRDAMRYSELSTKGKGIVAKAKEPAIKPLKPGSSSGKKKSKTPAEIARRRAAQTGRVSDAATALEALMPD